jgi:trimeric autotransporter adhesin
MVAQPCLPGWQTPGDNLNDVVHGFMRYSEGAIPSLFAFGNFTRAGGRVTGPIARWDGHDWSALGEVRLLANLHAAVVFDAGDGEALYVSGLLLPSPGFDSNGIAKWDGAAWSPVGEGLMPSPGGPSALFIHDDGSGPGLHAAGSFYFPLLGPWTNQPKNLGKWTGTYWEPVGGGMPWVTTAASFNDGAGAAIYMITAVGGQTAWRWDGATLTEIRGRWASVGGRRFVVRNGVSGPELFLAGAASDGMTSHPGLFQWTGSDWDHIARTTNSPWTAYVADDGWLYLGGSFHGVNNMAMRNIARWNGSGWQGVEGEQLAAASVRAIMDWDDSTGPAVFAGGILNTVIGSARFVARYHLCNLFDPCYANCDGSSAAPILNVGDFLCYISEFAAATSLPHVQQVDHYANCDASTTAPALNVDDFTCFMNQFAAGCP